MKFLSLLILNNVFCICLCLSFPNYCGFGGIKSTLNPGINIKLKYGFINGNRINEYYRKKNNNNKDSYLNFKLFGNEDIININEEEIEAYNENNKRIVSEDVKYEDKVEFENMDIKEKEDGQIVGNDEVVEEDEYKDMMSNEEFGKLRKNKKLKIPYIIDYPTDRVEREPDMTKEDVARSILSELGFFNESDCSVGNNSLYNELKEYNYNDSNNSNEIRGQYINFMEDTTSRINLLFGNEDIIDINEEEKEAYNENKYLKENNERDKEEKEDYGGDTDRDNCNYLDYLNDKISGSSFRYRKNEKLVLRRENVMKFIGNSGGTGMGKGISEPGIIGEGTTIGGTGGIDGMRSGRLGLEPGGDYEDEEPINKDYLVRTSTVDKLRPKIEEGDTPSILEEQESPVIGKQRVRWFPNHVSKSLRKLHDYIKLADIILDVRDGRVPFIPPNDYLFNLFESEFPSKPRITVFTHSDVLPKIAMAEWMNYYRKINKSVTTEFNRNINNPEQRRVENKTMFVDARNGLKEIIYLKKYIYKMCMKIRIKSIEKGMKPRSIRAIVIGMPNVGKSSLINRILGRRVARAYDIPGTTRDINIYNEDKDNKSNKSKLITMIDTPGFVCPIQDNHRLINDYNSIFSKRIIGNNKRKYELGNGYERDRRMLVYSGLNIIGEAAYEVDEVALVILEEIIKMLIQNPRYVDYIKIKQKYPLLASLINKYTPIKIKRKIIDNNDNTRNSSKIKQQVEPGKEKKEEYNEIKDKKRNKQKKNNADNNNIYYDNSNIRYNQEDLEQEVSEKMDRISTWLFGGNLDSCCSRFLTDFRKGRLGQIMLQSPPMLNNFYLNYLDGNRKYKKEKEKKKSKNVDKVVEYNRGVYEGW